MKQVLRIVEQYVVPYLLIGAGVAAVIMYARAEGLETQPTEMVVGGLCLIGAGIFMTPIFNKLIRHNIVARIFGVILVVAAVILGYKVYDVIASESEHRADRDAAQAATIQRFKDIRLAQEQYKLYNGTYTPDFDELITFLRKDTIPVPYRNGNVMEDKYFNENPDKMKIRNTFIVSRNNLSELGMTEAEAVKNHYEVRDTSYISIEQKFFSDEARAKKKLPKVNIDELPFNPHSEERFLIRYTEQASELVAKGRKPDVYLKIKDPTPYRIDQEDRVKKDTLMLGSLDMVSLDGNWTD